MLFNFIQKLKEKDKKINHLENQIKTHKEDNLLLKNEIKECKKKLDERNDNDNNNIINMFSSRDNNSDLIIPFSSRSK
jgi:hypothetical protein